MAFRSGFLHSPHDHDAWNRLLWNRHGEVFGSGRSFGLILSIDSQLGSSTRLSCVYSYMHRVVWQATVCIWVFTSFFLVFLKRMHSDGEMSRQSAFKK
jgi:hypothetical protein